MRPISVRKVAGFGTKGVGGGIVLRREAGDGGGFVAVGAEVDEVAGEALCFDECVRLRVVVL